MNDFPIFSSEPAYFDVRLVGKHVGEVQVAGHPINGNAADTGFADTRLDDMCEFSAIGPPLVDAVMSSIFCFEINPINPDVLAGLIGFVVVLEVHMQNIVSGARDGLHGLGLFMETAS